MRVAICAVYPDDNRGSAALTAAAIRAVTEAFDNPSVSLIAAHTLHDKQPYRHTRGTFPDVELLPPAIPVGSGPLAGVRAVVKSLFILLRPRPVAPTIQRIMEADIVMSRGGVVFVDHGSLPRLLSFWLTVFPLVLARRLDKPAVIYSTTIGPFEHRSYRILNRWLLRRVTLVFARDPLSFSEALSMGLKPPQLEPVPDSVFRFLPSASGKAQSLQRRYGIPVAGRFGVATVRQRDEDHSTEDDGFLHAVATVISTLLGSGVIDRFAVVVQVDGSGVSDVERSLELVERIGDKRAVLVRDDLPPEGLMTLYGAAEFVIGCRLHSAVLALVAGTPALVPSFRKSVGVLESLGLGNLVIPYPSFDPAAVTQLMRDIVWRQDAFRREIRRVVGAARRQVHEADRLLREALYAGKGQAAAIQPGPSFRGRD
jgi:colanic acid/amylovoran biosynthesis protein